MKMRVLILGALVCLLAMAPAMSQVLETKWTADIPFDFIVGNSPMPAGHYVIKSNAHSMRLTVVNTETEQTASMFTRSVQKLTPAGKTILIFQREGGRHVLHQVWGENNTRGHDIVHGSDVVELESEK